MKASIERKYGLLFISPFLIGFGAFVLYPVGASLVYSFCNYDIVTPPRYIGVRNYTDLMGDELFLKSLYNTLFFTVFSVPLTMLIGFLLASAFPAMVVYAQELIPGRVGTVSGLFFGLAFGMGGIGAALLGKLADARGIEFVYRVCAFLPAIGLLTAFLPAMGRRRKT